MKEELEFLKKNLNYIFGASIVSNELRSKYFEELKPPLDKMLISAVTRTLIQGLASIVDTIEDKKGNKNLTIFLIDKVDLSSHKETIGKIRDIRHKMISHNDLESNLQSEDFVRNVNLTVEESEALLDYLIDIVSKETKELMPKEEIKKNYTEALKQLFGF